MRLNVAEYASISMNIPIYRWKRLNKLFWLYQASEYTWPSHMFDRLLKMFQVLNVPGICIWHDCICKDYTEFWIYLNMAQYASIIPEHVLITLNMPEHNCSILLNVPKYARNFLNKLLWLCQDFQYASSSEMFDSVSNMP